MPFAVFTYRPQSKCKLIFYFLLKIITQSNSWVTWSTYELFYYKACSYSMKGVMTCSENEVSRCLAQTQKDCKDAKTIIVLFIMAMVQPLIILFFTSMYTVMFYFWNWKNIVCFSNQLLLSVVFYGMSSFLFFLDANNMAYLQSDILQVNSQIYATSIALGFLNAFIAFTLKSLHSDFDAYCKQLQKQPSPPTQSQPPIKTKANIINQQVTYTNIQIQTQRHTDINIQLQTVIQQETQGLRNVQLSIKLQQRNSPILNENQMINLSVINNINNLES